MNEVQAVVFTVTLLCALSGGIIAGCFLYRGELRDENAKLKKRVAALSAHVAFARGAANTVNVPETNKVTDLKVSLDPIIFRQTIP